MPSFDLSKLLHRNKKLGKAVEALGASLASHPTLPTELTLAILTLAASDPLSGQAALASFARLCHAIRPWAEKRLYSHPIVTSTRQLSLLRKTLKKSKRLAARVEGLTLDGADEQGGRRSLTPGLPELMRVAPALRSLEVRNAVVHSLVSFIGAEHLTHLTLRNTFLTDRTVTTAHHPTLATLPSLQSLTLSHTSFLPSTATAFLTHTIRPTLRHLELHGNCTLAGPELKRAMCEVEQAELLGGLEELVLGEGGEMMDEEDTVEGRRGAMVRMLTGTGRLRRLEVAVELVDLEGQALVKQLPASLEALVVLGEVPSVLHDSSGNRKMVEQRLRAKELRKFVDGCEGRGVSVVIA